MSVIEELVGEGKKFPSVEAALQGKLEADTFIEQLKNENKELRTLLGTTSGVEDRAATVQAILAKLGGASASNTAGTAPASQRQSESGNQSAKPVTEGDVRKLLLEMEQAKKAEGNLSVVEQAMLQKFGEKAKADEAIKAKANELGVTDDVLKTLAASSPKAYLRMMGLDANGPVSGGSVTSRGSVNTEALRTDGLIRDKAFYDKKKAEVGATKFALDAKLQQQMWRDMKALGDKFG